MTREEIFSLSYALCPTGEAWWSDDYDLIRFAQLVVAAEQERILALLGQSTDPKWLADQIRSDT